MNRNRRRKMSRTKQISAAALAAILAFGNVGSSVYADYTVEGMTENVLSEDLGADLEEEKQEKEEIEADGLEECVPDEGETEVQTETETPETDDSIEAPETSEDVEAQLPEQEENPEEDLNDEILSDEDFSEDLEIPDEEEEKPEFEYTEEFDGITVAVAADEGVFPEGTTAEIELLDGKPASPSNALLDEAGENPNEFWLDIAFCDEDGALIEDSWSRDGDVTVTVSGETIDEARAFAREAEIVRVAENGDEKTLIRSIFQMKRNGI